MIHKSQTARHKSRMAFVPKFPRTSEDESRSRWFDFNAPETQSILHQKPTAHLDELIFPFKNIGEFTTLIPQQQVSVKSDLTASHSVSISKAETLPQSIAAIVDRLIVLIGEEKNRLSSTWTAEDFQRLVSARNKLKNAAGENENHPFVPLIDFIANLIKNSNEVSGLLPHETEKRRNTANTVAHKPYRLEKTGRPTTLPHLKLADLLKQEIDNRRNTANTVALKPHRLEKTGRPATLPRLKLADLLAEEVDDNASEEADTGKAVGNEIW